MKFRVVTLFPELITSGLGAGVVGQAIKDGVIEIACTNPRDFSSGVHKSVDDRPFGGGDGMVMLPEILSQAIESAAAADNMTGARRIYLSARGPVLNDQKVRELAREKNLILVCGRYGGIDERLRDGCGLEELCIGDYVLSGGELAALIVIDAVARLQPGVLGNEVSAHAESFADGLLEAPQFTRPRQWRELDVPEVLMGGHHAHIKSWRRSLSILVTATNRPELLAQAAVSQREIRSAIEVFEALSENEKRACGLPLQGTAILLQLSTLHSSLGIKKQGPGA